MSIRCAAKALVLREGRLLLNRCREADGHVYYDLPGGGQRLYETLEDAVRREVREETGYTVEINRFVALAEEIYDDERLRQEYPDYAHRIYHIFLTHLTGEQRHEPTESDWHQDGSEWFTPEEVERLPRVFPSGIQNHLKDLLTRDAPLYLGCSHI